MSRRKRRGHYSSLVPFDHKVESAVLWVPGKQEKVQDTWAVECNDVTACSRAAEGEIHIAASLWYTLISLCQHFRKEWMGYMTGTMEGKVARIDDIYFPPQMADSAAVCAVEDAPGYAIRPGTIGSIHSHVGMSAKFSATDKDHANWPVEIVINNKAEYEATMRLKVPCGEYMRARALMHLTTDNTAVQFIESIEAGMAQGEALRLPAPSNTYERPYIGGENDEMWKSYLERKADDWYRKHYPKD